MAEKNQQQHKIRLMFYLRESFTTRYRQWQWQGKRHGKEFKNLKYFLQLHRFCCSLVDSSLSLSPLIFCRFISWNFISFACLPDDCIHALYHFLAFSFHLFILLQSMHKKNFFFSCFNSFKFSFFSRGFKQQKKSA